MQRLDTEVLVVGSGLTGATAALLLARYGVDTIMITKSRWVADSPRAHITNQRTMEVMRAVGLEEACYAQATPGELMANHVMLTAVAGQEFGRLWTWGNNPERLGEYASASPGRGCDLPQDRFEPILVGEAARLGTAIKFGTEFTGLDQDSGGVTAAVRDRRTGEASEIRARYLIGADGGQSHVADAINLPLTGTSGLSHALNVRFRADLSRHVAHRPGSLYWILQPDRAEGIGNAMLRMVRPWDDWVVGFVHLGEKVMDLTGEQVTDEIRSLIQDDSIPVSLVGIYPWRINHVIAERYSQGRVFCAGDAVHRHPPMNGLGGNTCIQDSFNLAWKIAAVLRGRAGAGLLETYSAERQPVGKRVVDRAIASWRQNPEVIRALGIDPSDPPQQRARQFQRLFEPSPEGEQRRRDFAKACASKAYSYHAHGVEMNQIYRSAAVVTEGLPEFQYPRDPELYYTATSYPGARLPHCWVGRDGATCSTLDLVGQERFTLLARVQGAAWVRAAQHVSELLGIELPALMIGPGCVVADLYGDWERRCGVGETGCLLVRPDQHVAWRCESLPGDPRQQLHAVMCQILARA
jgi:2,4-dichlorophenol 6-monooxygenase